MSTWEDRMAERAAMRRMVREAEAWANDSGPPLIAGFEQGTVFRGPAIVFPPDPPPEQPEGIPWS